MINYREHFEGKKIVVMGLGLLGRGLNDAIFLAEQGADLTITDLKSPEELEFSLKKLRRFRNIKYRLGQHNLVDFQGADLILKAAGVPIDSPFVAEARKNGIPVEMDASLFAKLAPEGVVLIGITGTRGKTTTTYLIYEILKVAGKRAYLAGNIRGQATLPLLKKVKSGDFVVAELDSWQLQGFHDAKLSPKVAVFTTFFDDHLIYYGGDRNLYFSDKEAIYKYQKPDDVLVVGEQAADKIKKTKPRGRMVIANSSDVPVDWKLKILGEHNRSNVACAVAAARALGISLSVIKKAVMNFKNVPGRLELIRTVGGVKIYNDTTATTPEATLAALKAFGKTSVGKIILICGGSDKGLDMSGLVAEITKKCKSVFLLPGSGSDKLPVGSFGSLTPLVSVKTLEEAVTSAFRLAKRGDIILFSPAFASFGMFKNEYDRGEQFSVLVKKIK